LFKAKVEGTILEVCEHCSKYGELIETKPVRIVRVKRMPKVKEEEDETVIVDDYGKKIIEARKKINLTREEFAKKIGEKESVIKRIESEEMRPDDKLTEKIERFLKIKLKVSYEESKVTEKPKRGKLTLGDVVEIE
jgi:putative transcription factor